MLFRSPETATVTWEGGIRLDPDVLYHDIARHNPIQQAGGSKPAVG